MRTKTTEKKTKAKPAPQLWLIVQQGGSSAEWYPSSYDTKEEAEAAIIEIKQATYDAIGPYQIPDALAKALLGGDGAEGDLAELLGEICGDVTNENFSDLEPEDAEDEDDE